jgi:hypothetical protein
MPKFALTLHSQLPLLHLPEHGLERLDHGRFNPAGLGGGISTG